MLSVGCSDETHDGLGAVYLGELRGLCIARGLCCGAECQHASAVHGALIYGDDILELDD